MKILLTGANGFVGQSVLKLLQQRNIPVIATGREVSPVLPLTSNVYQQMDFTDPFIVHDIFETQRPDIVIHAGAMTKVDESQQNQWAAFVSNVEGTINLLLNAEAHKSFFIFLSSDFVFDGKKGNYEEEDPDLFPVNFYGKTKLEAEEAVREYEHGWAIVRTSLVYGKSPEGKTNIITLIKNKIESGEEYGLVNDQYRSPTYVDDLAKAIITIAEKKATGIYHISGKEIMTPYQMAIATATSLNHEADLIKELNESNFSQPAKRPARTNLNIDKARKLLDYEPLPFAEGLRKTLS